MPTPSNRWIPDNGMMTTIWNPGDILPPASCKNLWKSKRVAGYFYKECPTGQSGSGIYLIVPAGKFGSLISQEEADKAAWAYLQQEGKRRVQVEGSCLLGSFTEIFSNLTGVLNWDWVANRETDFPHATRHLSAIVDNPPFNNTVRLPLLGLFCYEDNDYLVPTDRVQYDLHNEHGFMHIDLKTFHPEKDGLLVEWAPTTATFEGLGLTAQDPTVYYQKANFISMFIGDFGSEEVHVDTQMGGAMFELVTSRRKVEENGKISGTYFVCFKEDVNVWLYNPAIEDYEIVYNVPYEMNGVSSYWGASIIIDQFTGLFKSELYLNGAWQLDIPDNDLVYVKSCPYMRGLTSMDFWFGDAFIGRIPYVTNRIPPALHTVYLQPSTVQPFPPTKVPEDSEDESDAGKWYIPPTATVGDTPNQLPVSLAGGTATAGYQGHWPNWAAEITENGGGQTFAAAHVWANFDYREGGLPPKPFGCSALLVYQFRTMSYLQEAIPGTSRKFLAPMLSRHFVNVQLPENPFMGDLYEPSIWDAFYENGTDMIRSRCWERWQSQTPDLHPMTIDYRAASDSIDLIVNENEGALDLERLATFWYKPTAAWTGVRVLEDVYSEIRAFLFKTGVKGIRTREPLEAPVYNIPACPLPVNCVNYNVLMTLPAIAAGVSGGLAVSTGQLCDSLFGGLYSVEQGGWDWTVVVEDVYVSTGEGTDIDPFMFTERFIRVTVSMVSAKLMDDFLQSSSQLTALKSRVEEGITLRLYVSNGSMPVDTAAELYEWPIPVYETELPLADYTLNVPPLPPSGGPGMPSEATFIFHLPIGEPLGTTLPDPLALKEGYTYRAELFNRNGDFPPTDYLTEI